MKLIYCIFLILACTSYLYTSYLYCIRGISNSPHSANLRSHTTASKGQNAHSKEAGQRGYKKNRGSNYHSNRGSNHSPRGYNRNNRHYSGVRGRNIRIINTHIPAGLYYDPFDYSSYYDDIGLSSAALASPQSCYNQCKDTCFRECTDKGGRAFECRPNCNQLCAEECNYTGSEY